MASTAPRCTMGASMPKHMAAPSAATVPKNLTTNTRGANRPAWWRHGWQHHVMASTWVWAMAWAMRSSMAGKATFFTWYDVAIEPCHDLQTYWQCKLSMACSSSCCIATAQLHHKYAPLARHRQLQAVQPAAPPGRQQLRGRS